MGDVVRLAGVPAQTVSRVATGFDHMHPNTRVKVPWAMSKLGCSPNCVAQALRRDSFKTIGVLIRQIQHAGEALTTMGVPEAATAADYVVSLAQVERPVSSDLYQAVYRFSHRAIDGLVVVQTGRAGREYLVLPPSIPVAVPDFTLVDHYPSASASQVGGVRDAVEHPLGLGRHSIQYVCGPGDSQSGLIRRATWARYLQKMGLLAPEPIPGNWEAAASYAVGRLLIADPEMTAVFCANDELALGLIQAIHEQGRRVPGDISVVGLDGSDVGEHSSPPPTTVRQDFRRHGHEMVGLVLEQMASGVRDDGWNIIIPTELILRGSTTPPPAT